MTEHLIPPANAEKKGSLFVLFTKPGIEGGVVEGPKILHGLAGSRKDNGVRMFRRGVRK